MANLVFQGSVFLDLFEVLLALLVSSEPRGAGYAVLAALVSVNNVAEQRTEGRKDSRWSSCKLRKGLS